MIQKQSQTSNESGIQENTGVYWPKRNGTETVIFSFRRCYTVANFMATAETLINSRFYALPFLPFWYRFLGVYRCGFG